MGMVQIFGRIVALPESNRAGLETPLPIEVLVVMRYWINSHNASSSLAAIISQIHGIAIVRNNTVQFERGAQLISLQFPHPWLLYRWIITKNTPRERS